ncbi:MAG TPA: alpha-L-fucosidase, partial [Dehalococcoidales bacterium]|nr:alpha-L-fucosidase [Dehalococcoidales bacterium]
LLARGYKNGKEITTCRVETAGGPAAITLAPFRNTLKADGEDAAIITVEIQDAQGRRVPTADNDITFSIEGPARIIGVGNGNPSSHEPDVFLTQRPMRSAPVGNWTWKKVSDARRKDLAEITADFDDSAWAKHNIRSETGPLTWDEHGIFRSTATVSESDLAADKVLLSFGCIDQQGWIYVNGKEAGQSMDWRAAPAIDIKSFLHPGTNSIAVAVVNFDGPGGINKGASLLFLEKPILPTWKRKTFNGLAQVIIQSTGQTGDITVTGAGEGLKPAVLKIPAAPATPRPSEPTLYRLKENSLSVAGGIITDNPELSDLSGNQLPEDKKPTIEAFENNAVSEKAHNENRMKAWKEAKFGLFLHWGVYSVYGGTYKGKELWSAEWIQENARIPGEEYSKTAASWNPSEFNAKEWVSYAKSAGMKYLVFTSRHHDGFAMYPSNASSYNLMDATQYKGPDPLAALKQACHEEGLLFGIYYSPLEFRGSPNGFDKEDEEAVKNGFSYKTLGPKPYATDDEIAALAKKQIRELIINYKPDILWFDGVWDKMGRWLRQDSQEVVKLIEELAPDTIINDR